MTSPSPDDELTIGELARHSGVPASALRFYEREHLIQSRRNAGNQRRFPKTAIGRVAFIRASQSVGIPLAMIREVLAFLPEGAGPTREFWVRASACWNDMLDARIAQLERTRDIFVDCQECGCLSFDQCALINRAGRLDPTTPLTTTAAGRRDEPEPDGAGLGPARVTVPTAGPPGRPA